MFYSSQDLSTEEDHFASAGNVESANVSGNPCDFEFDSCKWIQKWKGGEILREHDARTSQPTQHYCQSIHTDCERQ